jgi:hypothetical protein
MRNPRLAPLAIRIRYCAIAGIAVIVATAKDRRKSRAIHIGYLTFMSVVGPDPAAALSMIDLFGTP